MSCFSVFNFANDAIDGYVSKAGGKIRKQALERQEFLERRIRPATRSRHLIAVRRSYLATPSQRFLRK